MNSTISIVTPLYNSEKYVTETINSVLAQTYPYWEMIIVDDGSTDDSYEIVNQYAIRDNRIKLYRREHLPKGGTVCRNIGIDKSTGEYLMFLDSDDLLYPFCLQNRIDTVMSHPDIDFAVFQMDAFTPDEKIKERLLTQESDNYLYAFLSHNLPWAITCPLWKSEFLKGNLKKFDERFPRLQDPEFHTRALLIDNVKFKVYPDSKYTDCSYRVDYKKPNLSLFLEGCKLYLETFIEKVKDRSDKNNCLNALGMFFDNIYSHYVTSGEEDMKSNLKRIAHLNSFFLSNKLISQKVYKKARLFLFCIKYDLFKCKLFTFTLRKLGFRSFYGYRI